MINNECTKDINTIHILCIDASNMFDEKETEIKKTISCKIMLSVIDILLLILFF
jgi:hypothetical protein